MRWQVLVLVVLAGVLGACGNKEIQTGPREVTPTGVAACLNNDVVEHSRGLARVDLDGDGGQDAVNFSPGSGSCSNLVLTTLDGQLRAVKAPVDLSLGRVTVSAITIPGRRGQLLVAIVRHPRGGFGPYLFGYTSGQFEQVTRNRHPVIGFVATDTGLAPFSAHCAPQGIEVDTAKQRSGAWTVRRTIYTVTGNEVTRTRRSVIASGLSEDKLTQQYAGLVRHDLFEDCKST